MKKIRILFVHANNYDVGGADYCLFKMIKELDTEVFDPIVLLSKDTAITALYKKNNLEYVIKPIVRLQKMRNPIKFIGILLKYPLTIYQIAKIIKERNIQIVHSNDLLDFAGSIAGKLRGIKTVQHVRMILKDSLLKKAIVSVVVAVNDLILCVSNSVRQNMFPIYPNVKVLYDWIDMDAVGHAAVRDDLRKELNLPPSTKLIGSVGRMEYWKGQHVLVKAAARLLNKLDDIHFVLVGGVVLGKEGYYEEIKIEVQKQSLEKHISFLGERKDIVSILEQLTIFVHSSVEPDPFPGTVLEALFNNIPVIGANAGGVPEEVENGITGLLYIPGSSEDMSEKILQLLTNNDLLADMRMKARSNVLNKFDKTMLSNQLMAEYKILLNHLNAEKSK